MDTSLNPFEAYAGVLRAVAELLPGYGVLDLGRPGAFILMLSSFGLPSLNRLLLPRLDTNEVADAIATVAEASRQAGVLVNWWLDPGTEPVDLERTLLGHGHEMAGTGSYPVMSRNLVDLPNEPAPGGVELGFVQDANGMRASQMVAGTGFGRPEAAVMAMADAMASPAVLADPRVAVVAARADGGMVGAGTLMMVGGVAGILNVATLEEARGRGIGRAVTLELLHEAARRGGTLAALHASRLGFPIYQRMGFRHDGDVKVVRGPVGARP